MSSRMRLLPSLIYSTHVIDDECGRFREGEQTQTGLLVNYHHPAYFETTNTMYILIGKGTRKTVDADLAAAIYF